MEFFYIFLLSPSWDMECMASRFQTAVARDFRWKGPTALNGGAGLSWHFGNWSWSHLVIKHGWLENPPWIEVWLGKSHINGPVSSKPCVMKPEGNAPVLQPFSSRGRLKFLPRRCRRPIFCPWHWRVFICRPGPELWRGGTFGHWSRVEDSYCPYNFYHMLYNTLKTWVRTPDRRG